jgi:GntR family transcriptional regulator
MPQSVFCDHFKNPLDNFSRLLYYQTSTEDAAMFFQIDFGDTLPIYDQVVRQIKFAVAGGVLKENELIPSVRELARELTINPNTVARAYHRLQDDGILTSVRGTGLAVAAGAASRCRDERVELIRLRLEQVLAEAKQSRIDPLKLRELVEEQLVKAVPAH